MNLSTTSNIRLTKRDKIDRLNFELHEDLNDCIEDTADNYTQEHPDYYCLSPDVFEAALFSILKEQIEKVINDFSTNPHQHLTPQQQARLNAIASEYLADS